MDMPSVLKIERIHVWAGHLLRQAREAKGYSQEALGQLVHATRESVNAWESGRQTPGGTKIARLASALDREPGDFYVVRERATE